MGVATGCGCKEVYRFPHTSYLSLLLLYLLFFTAASLIFCSLKKNVFRSLTSRMQASGERRRVLHRRPRICMPKHCTFIFALRNIALGGYLDTCI